LFAYYPAGLLPACDPLVRGAVKLLETRKKSGGGLPVGTGWMKDGLWVAMALDNVASAYLRMGEYDKACAYFYPALNHATPFVTWCEERGAERNSDKKSGDLQHLWTPVSVCRFMREMMIMEYDGRLHIACATPREWLAEGQRIGIKNARTYNGKLDFTVARGEGGAVLIDMRAERPVDIPVEIHVRLPLDEYSLKVTRRDCDTIGIARQSVTVMPAGDKRGVSIELGVIEG
jgi:hypothetical protein